MPRGRAPVPEPFLSGIYENFEKLTSAPVRSTTKHAKNITKHITKRVRRRLLSIVRIVFLKVCLPLAEDELPLTVWGSFKPFAFMVRARSVQPLFAPRPVLSGRWCGTTRRNAFVVHWVERTQSKALIQNGVRRSSLFFSQNFQKKKILFLVKKISNFFKFFCPLKMR